MNTSMTYLSLLRGINIGGRKKIRMQDLAQLYEVYGLSECAHLHSERQCHL